MSQAQPPPIPSGASPLRKWKWRSFVLTVLYVGAFLFLGYVTLGLAPKYEKIFEELLGDRSKIPTATQWVIGMSRFMQGNALTLLPLLLFSPPILLWVFRGNRVVSLGILVMMALMVALSVAAIPALMVPHVQLIESIGRVD